MRVKERHLSGLSLNSSRTVQSIQRFTIPRCRARGLIICTHIATCVKRLVQRHTCDYKERPSVCVLKCFGNNQISQTLYTNARGEE